MKAYPFSYGKHAQMPGWVGVVLPSILDQMDDKARRCIGEAQSGVALAADEIRWVRGHCSKRGPIDVVYRQKPSGLTDHVGRGWDYCEGFVIERADPHFQFTAAHFDEAHAAMQPRYADFLASKTPWDSAKAASHLELPLTPREDVPLKLHSGKIETSRICPPLERKSKVDSVPPMASSQRADINLPSKKRPAEVEDEAIDLDKLHAQASAAHESSKTFRELDPVSKGVDKMSSLPFGLMIGLLLLGGGVLMMTTCSLMKSS
jgi:hypothetical protein